MQMRTDHTLLPDASMAAVALPCAQTVAGNGRRIEDALTLAERHMR